MIKFKICRVLLVLICFLMLSGFKNEQKVIVCREPEFRFTSWKGEKDSKGEGSNFRSFCIQDGITSLAHLSILIERSKMDGGLLSYEAFTLHRLSILSALLPARIKPTDGKLFPAACDMYRNLFSPHSPLAQELLDDETLLNLATQCYGTEWTKNMVETVSSWQTVEDSSPPRFSWQDEEYTDIIVTMIKLLNRQREATPKDNEQTKAIKDEALAFIEHCATNYFIRMSCGGLRMSQHDKLVVFHALRLYDESSLYRLISETAPGGVDIDGTPFYCIPSEWEALESWDAQELTKNFSRFLDELYPERVTERRTMIQELRQNSQAPIDMEIKLVESLLQK